MAFEMAWQLEQLGETVALLAILDTSAPELNVVDPTISHTDLDWLHGIVSLFEQLTGFDFGISLDALQAQPLQESAYLLVMQAFQHHGVFFAPRAPVDELKFLVDTYRIAVKAQKDYRIPGKVRCPISLFLASEHSANDLFAPITETWGWEAHTEVGVEIISVPGTHVTMMTEPHVQHLARQLGNRMHL